MNTDFARAFHYVKKFLADHGEDQPLHLAAWWMTLDVVNRDPIPLIKQRDKDLERHSATVRWGRYIRALGLILFIAGIFADIFVGKTSLPAWSKHIIGSVTIVVPIYLIFVGWNNLKRPWPQWDPHLAAFLSFLESVRYNFGLQADELLSMWPKELKAEADRALFLLAETALKTQREMIAVCTTRNDPHSILPWVKQAIFHKDYFIAVHCSLSSLGFADEKQDRYWKEAELRTPPEREPPV